MCPFKEGSTVISSRKRSHLDVQLLILTTAWKRIGLFQANCHLVHYIIMKYPRSLKLSIGHLISRYRFNSGTFTQIEYWLQLPEVEGIITDTGDGEVRRHVTLLSALI